MIRSTYAALTVLVVLALGFATLLIAAGNGEMIPEIHDALMIVRQGK